MAEIHSTDYFTERQYAPEKPRGLANVIGAAVSAALLLGAGVWGYKLMVRAANGIPVVHASQEPMRVQPMAPGGDVASHQGLSVNAVAAEGASSEPSNRLVLAPPPTALDSEDLPAGERLGTKAKPEALTRNLIIDNLVSDILAEAAASDPTRDPPVPGGIGQSRRPVARPDARVFAAQGEFASVGIGAQPEMAQAKRLDPATLETGMKLAQLGAFDTADMAEQAWARLNNKFREFLEGRDYVIQTADRGGQTVYRLRTTGFDNLDAARRFCSALAAEKAECIPVVIR